MKKRIGIIGIIIGTVGYGLLIHRDWRIAIAVFIINWAQNIENENR